MADKSIVPPGPLPYKPEYFVNRTEEREFVTKKADALAQGKPVDKRTIIFTGQRGTGRRTGAARLASGVTVALVDISDITTLDKAQ